ncbi:MAG: PAS domain S-box protein [Nitrospirae bacterium]|nr:PAS domain S-box protein [Nitrospirota bacterium]
MMEPDQNEKRLLALENALRESESRFSAIASITADAVIMVDETQNIIFFNKGAELIFGYPSSEVIGLPLDLLMPDRFAQSHRKQIHAFGAETAPSRFMKDRIPKIWGRRRDGSEFPAEASISKWKQNRQTIFTAVLRDISERIEIEDKIKKLNEELEDRIRERTFQFQKANEALQEEKEWLAVIIASIGDGVIATDTHGKVILLNKVAEEFTGWSLEEASGKNLEEVFHIINQKNRELCENIVKKVLKSGEAVELANHTVLVSKNRAERVIADSAAPILRENKTIIGIVLVFRDVTKKERTEEELLRVQKLESLGLLAGGIAHDFNNILTGILGNISLARTWANPEDRLFERLTEAEKASHRARDLALQLLTFAKGGTPIKRVVLITDFMEQSVLFALRGASVRSQFFFKDGLWPVEIDENQISQVIHNLVINAQQAMPEGGIIQIHAENMTVASDQEKLLPFKKGNYVKISITDNGMGIPEDALSKIFDPYFTTKAKGSGLGLAICYSIIQKHDGLITVESNPGRGTTFFLYLPASSQTLTPRNSEGNELKRGTGRVMVMDDEESILDVVRTMLEHLGYEPDCAKGGTMALKKYKEARDSGRPYDVLITDLTVPGDMGGIELLQRLKEIDPRIKVIVSSGYSNESIIANFKSHGFSGAIMKPYSINDLSETLHRIISDFRT